MILYQTIRHHLKTLGINPPSQSSQMCSINWKLSLGFLIFAIAFIANTMFLVYLAKTIVEYTQCACVLSGLIEICLYFAAIVMQKARLFGFMETMEKLINKRMENPATKVLHSATNRKVEKICKYFHVGVGKVAPTFIVWSKFVGCIATYFTSDLGGDSFELPMPAWLPFKWTNPIGYTVACTLEYISTTYVFFIMMITASIGISFYSYEVSLTNETKSILHVIETKLKIRKNQRNFYGKFIEFVDLHSAAKQSTLMFSTIFQPVFMIVFPRNILALCTTMLLVQLQLSHRANFGMALVLLSFDALNSFIMISICCEIGQRISDAFEEINDIIDQQKWYLFPKKLKRILPTIMAVSQEPVVLECFGSISCCREVFRKMLKSALSYFMVLRQFIK